MAKDNKPKKQPAAAEPEQKAAPERPRASAKNVSAAEGKV